MIRAGAAAAARTASRLRPITAVVQRPIGVCMPVRHFATNVTVKRSTMPFVRRHNGPLPSEYESMLAVMGMKNMDELVERTVPDIIRLKRPLEIEDSPLSEAELIKRFDALVGENRVFRSYIGQGYYNTFTLPVLQRNVLENPGWYSQYTPYQPEISQGRLESLLNYQTMVSDLTGAAMANASLLDEATACAEAMALAFGAGNRKKQTRFLVDRHVHPQNIAVLRTRAEPFGVEVAVQDFREFDFGAGDVCGVLVQYPNTEGTVEDYSAMAAAAQKAKAMVACATDLLALTQLKPPGEWGADVVLGNSQRFGVPLGYGGPHAAFFATHAKHARKMPGRIVGLSKDARGQPAIRLALQAREQHIRRERATSNICTAQALLANMAANYAVYHGPGELRNIAAHAHACATAFADAVAAGGGGGGGAFAVAPGAFFDTVKVTARDAAAAEQVRARCAERQINVRVFDDARSFGVAMDETVSSDDLADLLYIFGVDEATQVTVDPHAPLRLPADLVRTSPFLTHRVFNSYHSETLMMRYLKQLENADLSLVHSMTPLGSCTMKLNAAVELRCLSTPACTHIHPFVPTDQTLGYQRMFKQLERDLCEVTGYDAFSLQPNSGANGEYSGLRCIDRYHAERGEPQRKTCLIPISAHGTNPASAHMAGFDIVTVLTDVDGNIDLDDLTAKAAQHRDTLSCIMLTYPSTYGVFEDQVRRVCDVVHENGGQVYMDGANLNAQLGLCRPGDLGSDVSHLNLHKTFCIPHGGGGPGMGPIGVRAHLAKYLPGSVVTPGFGGAEPFGDAAGAMWGSPSILPISWSFIRLLGGAGLKEAASTAVLNSNYMARRLREHFPILFREHEGQLNAHEFILDTRHFKAEADVEAADVAKRLQDYGFHAPTMSWPVANTLMIEPTESEDKAELDRYCDALISIRNEVRMVAAGELDRVDNPLKNAPHTQDMVIADAWNHKYSREMAAYPAPWLRKTKFWPSIARVDDVFGDRNLQCTRPDDF